MRSTPIGLPDRMECETDKNVCPTGNSSNQWIVPNVGDARHINLFGRFFHTL